MSVHEVALAITRPLRLGIYPARGPPHYLRRLERLELPQPSRLCHRTSQSLIRARRFSSLQASLQAEPVSPTTPKTPPRPPPSSNSKIPLPSTGGINIQEDDPTRIDWTTSFHGLSVEPFSKDAAQILLAPLEPDDVEIKPDGIIYLPEIKYRRILNKAFGPGGWGLAPRGETIVTEKAVTREYALLAHGRLVSVARGEQTYFSKDGIPTASEGCKSNAMMRCCKDLGVASELWDPRFIRKFRSERARDAFVEHQVTKKRTKIWLLKGDPISYPFKETRA